MMNGEIKRKINNARDILVGVVPTPSEQVQQITYALIYKFMDDMDREATEKYGSEPYFFSGEYEKYAWHNIMAPNVSGQEKVNLYTQGIEKMQYNDNLPQLFRDMFKNAFVPFRNANTLNMFLKEINEFQYDHSEELGNAYEYLLSILGSQGDAGQFRTPRHIIDFIVEVVDPGRDETILDPACGTAGFLISSYKHIKKKEEENKDFKVRDQRNLAENLVGYEVSPQMAQLSRVNMYLHKFLNPKIYEYDTLTSEERWEEKFDIIMANPPFMTPKGGIQPHNKFSVQAKRSEVLFVDYIAEHLNPRGRAGVIVPEGIVFKNENAYKQLRKMLIEENYLYAVISLPAGVFKPYSGVKTSILFFDKELAKRTDHVLFVKVEKDGYDLGDQRNRLCDCVQDSAWCPEHSDLPRALDVIENYKQSFNDSNDGSGLRRKDVKGGFAQLVSKKEISRDGDYNLSGNRYVKDLKTLYQEEIKKMEKTIYSCKGVLQNFSQQYNKQPKQTRKQIENAMQKVKQTKEQIDPTIQDIEKLKKQIEPSIQQLKKFNDFFEKNMKDTVIRLEENLGKLDLQKLFQIIQEESRKIKENKWPLVELKDLAVIDWGNTNLTKKSYIKNGDFLGVSAMGCDGRMDKYEHEVGTIVLSAIGARCGKIFYPSEKFTAIKNTITFTPKKEKIDPRYLFYLMDNNNLPKRGCGQPFISKGDVEKYKVPLPPLEEQEKIVEELDRYQKIIDGAQQVIDNYQPTIKINPEW